jgi:hypothetical protein
LALLAEGYSIGDTEGIDSAHDRLRVYKVLAITPLVLAVMILLILMGT